MPMCFSQPMGREAEGYTSGVIFLSDLCSAHNVTHMLGVDKGAGQPMTMHFFCPIRVTKVGSHWVIHLWGRREMWPHNYNKSTVCARSSPKMEILFSKEKQKLKKPFKYSTSICRQTSGKARVTKKNIYVRGMVFTRLIFLGKKKSKDKLSQNVKSHYVPFGSDKDPLPLQSRGYERKVVMHALASHRVPCSRVCDLQGYPAGSTVALNTYSTMFTGLCTRGCQLRKAFSKFQKNVTDTAFPLAARWVPNIKVRSPSDDETALVMSRTSSFRFSHVHSNFTWMGVKK